MFIVTVLAMFLCGRFAPSCRQHTLAIVSSESLVDSIQAGSLERVNLILERIDNVDQLVDGRAPLHYAVSSGSLEIVRALLARNADPNITDSHEITPLTEAIYSSRFDIANVLIEAGANINGIRGDPALFSDTKGAAGEGAPLVAAVYANNVNAIRFLESHGAALDIRTNSGLTPLIYAVILNTKSNNHIAIINELISSGADPDFEAASGETALFWAVRARDVDTVRLLIEHGADPYHKAHYHGRALPGSAIDIARAWRGEDAERLLDALGVDQS